MTAPSRANKMNETKRHPPLATNLMNRIVDLSTKDGKNKEMHITFAADVKGAAEEELLTQHDDDDPDDKHQAGAADAKVAAEQELFTQFEESDDEQIAGAAENPSQSCLSLTQCVDNKTLYDDPSTRGSITLPYILVKEEKKKEPTTPVHFVEKSEGKSIIKMGSAYRKNSCDVRLNALNAEGHAMNCFGLSNEAMVITYADGDTEVLQLTSTNSGKLVFYQGHTGNSWQIDPGQTIDLGDGDEVRFADNKHGSPAYSVIQFVHPLWTLDLPPEVKKTRDEAP